MYFAQQVDYFPFYLTSFDIFGRKECNSNCDHWAGWICGRIELMFDD